MHFNICENNERRYWATNFSRHISSNNNSNYDWEIPALSFWVIMFSSLIQFSPYFLSALCSEDISIKKPLPLTTKRKPWIRWKCRHLNPNQCKFIQIFFSEWSLYDGHSDFSGVPFHRIESRVIRKISIFSYGISWQFHVVCHCFWSTKCLFAVQMVIQ